MSDFGCSYCCTDQPGDEWAADEPHRCPIANAEIKRLRELLGEAVHFWDYYRIDDTEEMRAIKAKCMDAAGILL